MPFLYPSYIYLLFVSECPFFFFSFFGNGLKILVYKVIDLFLWFCKCVVFCEFPKYVIEWHHCYYKWQWQKHISLEDTSQLEFFLLLLIPLSSFYGFCDEVYDFVRYFVHFLTFYYPSLRDDVIGLFQVNPVFSSMVLISLMYWSMYRWFPVPLVHLWHPFWSSRNSLQYISEL